MQVDDQKIKFSDLKADLFIFNQKRKWLTKHDPKGLAEAISIEASELLEIFLWLDKKEASVKFNEEQFQERVREELADVIIYCFNFAINSKLDIVSLLYEKMEKNALKYPENQDEDIFSKEQS